MMSDFISQVKAWHIGRDFYLLEPIVTSDSDWMLIETTAGNITSLNTDELFNITDVLHEERGNRDPMTDAEMGAFLKAMDAQREELYEALAEDLE